MRPDICTYLSLEKLHKRITEFQERGITEFTISYRGKGLKEMMDTLAENEIYRIGIIQLQPLSSEIAFLMKIA